MEHNVGGEDELAKQPVSLTLTSYDESSSEPAKNGEMHTGSSWNDPRTGLGDFCHFSKEFD